MDETSHRTQFDGESGPQKAKTPAEARVINKWCPDSESNQGHGDFQNSCQIYGSMWLLLSAKEAP
jgi:hypothetical protein